MIALGIDIGGSATKGALVETKTGMLVSERIRCETEPMAKPKEIIDIIDRIRKELKFDGLIGAGYPGIVKHGMAKSAANVHEKFLNVDVAQMITHKTGLPATVINDADAAGLAEMRFGVPEARKVNVVMFITVGTGIGSAFFVNGQLMPNTEMGHLEICGKEAEHLASDAVRQAERLTWKQWTKRFNEVLKTYEALFNPELFILGGGISSRFKKYTEYLKTDTKILPARLENMAGIIGAAMAAQESKQD